MKYIVMEIDSKEEIFVFPRSVDHDRMVEACQAVRFGAQRDWTRKMFKQSPISAGFIDNGLCCGKSESLGIGSRYEKDTALLSSHFGVSK
jgi:hypothetical protein